MLPIIATALKLLPLVQGGLTAFNAIKESDKAQAAAGIVEAAQEVLTKAGKVTNSDNIANVLRSDAAARQEFVIAASEELERWKLAVTDVQHARVHSAQHRPLIEATANRVMVWNLPFVLVAVCLQVGCMFMFQENGALLALIGNVVGAVIQQAFAERNQVTSFLFGASITPPKDKADGAGS